MADWTIKRGDLEPPLRAQLFVPELDGEGNIVEEGGKPKLIPFNLKAAGATSVKLIMRKQQTGTPTIETAALTLIEEGKKGWVEHKWAKGETDADGTYDLEFEVMLPGERPRTIPHEKAENPTLAIDLDLNEKP